jgi:hypothetical protein
VYDGIPEVCVKRCSSVIVLPPVGKSGRNLVTGSERESLPLSASRRIAAAVNCFVTDPISNTCSGTIGTPSSTLAMP